MKARLTILVDHLIEQLLIKHVMINYSYLTLLTPRIFTQLVSYSRSQKKEGNRT